MKNYDFAKFKDYASIGEEFYIIYDGQKYFLQGYLDEVANLNHYEIQKLYPKVEIICDVVTSPDHLGWKEAFDKPLWKGTNLWEAEKDMEISDNEFKEKNDL